MAEGPGVEDTTHPLIPAQSASSGSLTAALARVAFSDGLGGLVTILLEALAKVGHFDTAFVTVVNRERGVLEVAQSFPTENPIVPTGASVPLPPDYPERAYIGVTRSSTGEDPLDPDSRIAKDLGLATYASLPLITADYRLFGMLCGASRRARVITDDTVAVMEYFARLIVDQMARDNARAADRRARMAEQRLKERIEFLAEAEHMLKSPIFIIDSYVHQLQEGLVRDTEVQRALATIADTTEELSTQVERLLEEVAADVRSRDLHLTTRDLVEEVRAMVKAFNGAAGHHQVRFRPLVEHLPARVDPAMLVQVLAHLLDNAVKYSEEGTTITIGVSARPPWAELTVRDQGVGLPSGIDVFAAFQRGGGSSVGGVGLGLHIVRKLVQGMDGDIRAESNPDGGATFTVTLPLNETT